MQCCNICIFLGSFSLFYFFAPLRRLPASVKSVILVPNRGLKRPPVNTSQLDAGRRTGALAMKVGMLGVWDKWGVRYPVTVLHVDNCQVVQVKTEENNGYTALQLGVGEAKVKRLNMPQKGHFKAAAEAGFKHVDVHNNNMDADFVPNRTLMEFKVSKDCLLDVGTPIYASHFVPGQYVDVCGVSKGKGFQGVMKRHNFAGGRATHGNSLNHRTPGSTGGRQDPGKVFKGKKMPGNMGNDRKTIQNLRILKIDISRNLLYIKGSITGQKGAFLRVTDAVKGPYYPAETNAEEAIATGGECYTITDSKYNPYTLPIPTMSTKQYKELLVSLQDRRQAEKEQKLADELSKMSAKAQKVEVKRRAAEQVDEIGSNEESAIISVWADTSGKAANAGQMNNVEVRSAGDAVVEVDPGKGVEVADPYAL